MVVAIVGLSLLALGFVVFYVGRLPQVPGSIEAFATHVFLWRSSGVGVPKLCFCAVTLTTKKMVVFVLGFPRIVLHGGDLDKVHYDGGRAVRIETSQYRVWLFLRYPGEWYELIQTKLRG